MRPFTDHSANPIRVMIRVPCVLLTPVALLPSQAQAHKTSLERGALAMLSSTPLAFPSHNSATLYSGARFRFWQSRVRKEREHDGANFVCLHREPRHFCSTNAAVRRSCGKSIACRECAPNLDVERQSTELAVLCPLRLPHVRVCTYSWNASMNPSMG